MKHLGCLVVAGVIALGGSVAVAQPALPSRFELRQIVLSDAIEDGAKDGRLGAAQVRELEAEQAEIATREAEFGRDGGLSEREVEVLEYLLDLASRRIDRALGAGPQVAQGK